MEKLTPKVGIGTSWITTNRQAKTKPIIVKTNVNIDPSFSFFIVKKAAKQVNPKPIEVPIEAISTNHVNAFLPRNGPTREITKQTKIAS